MFDLVDYRDYRFPDGVKLIDVLQGPGSLSEAIEKVESARGKDLVLFMGPYFGDGGEQCG
jgi:hypothetical protein